MCSVAGRLAAGTLNPIIMNTCKTIKDIKSVPFLAQFSEEQIRRQLAGNLKGIEEMRSSAIKTGKKVGCLTADQLTAISDNYKKMLA